THLEIPALTAMGKENFRRCDLLTNFKAPVLLAMEGSNFKECDELTRFEAPILTSIGDKNFYECKVLIDFVTPVLTTMGEDNFYRCYALTGFEAPMLTTIGYDNFRYCSALTDVQFGQHRYTVKSVDGLLTIIEKSKTLNEIEIHTGFIFNDGMDGVPDLSETFLVGKDGFFAHGETVKQAIEDLQFKIIAKKIKKEPIHEDTVITEAYYKTITGACTQGVKQWREQNNITEESFTAKELLPILEKTNAYGIEKFKALITFEIS
ncbi:leucine-rich repeat protein, partial [Flavobacterium sp.]|uniref:leucine-rich repeat protein n=1 Tax=Flavobacterium sp. TaxID=239 RepID=UPI0026233664